MSADRSHLNVGLNNFGSWNKYVYTNDDPVNGYDPTGQDCQLIQDGSGVFVLNCTGSPGSGGGGGGGKGGPTYNPTDPRPLTGSQEASLIASLQRRVKTGQESDCNALADYIDQVATPLEGSSNGPNALKAALAMRTPSQFPVYLIPGVSGNGGYNALNPNGATSGFQTQFQDQITNADQAHHFAAFFQPGFTYGTGVGNDAATWWEKLEGTAGNTGDINLGMAAAAIGSAVAPHLLPVTEVGQLVRDTLCNH